LNFDLVSPEDVATSLLVSVTRQRARFGGWFIARCWLFFIRARDMMSRSDIRRQENLSTSRYTADRQADRHCSFQISAAFQSSSRATINHAPSPSVIQTKTQKNFYSINCTSVIMRVRTDPNGALPIRE